MSFQTIAPIISPEYSSHVTGRAYSFTWQDIYPIVLADILADELNPLFIEIFAFIKTPFNGGDPKVTISEITSSTEVLGNAVVDLSDTYALMAQGYKSICIDQPGQLQLDFTFSGDAPTTGQGWIILRSTGMGLYIPVQYDPDHPPAQVYNQVLINTIGLNI